MFRWLANLIRGLTDSSANRSPRPGHSFRLRVEGLEDRACPATWTDGTGNEQAGDPRNWDDGIVPPTGAALTFTGAPGGSTDDCQGLSGSYSSFTIQGDYPGKITMGGAITVYSLEMWPGAGTIDQPGPGSGTDLTVTGYFNWFGGTINSTSNLANVNLSGATATISGTVSLGSNLNLLNGATATLGAGTTSVTNSIGISIGSNCGVNVDPGQGNTYTIQDNVGGIKLIINIGQNGFFRLLSGTAPLASAVYNRGGEFTLMAGTTIRLNSDLGQWVQNPQGGWQWDSSGHSYAQDSGITKLYNGSMLQVLFGLDAIIAGGMLTTVSDGNGSQSTINGNLTVLGGDIYIDAGADPHFYGTLYVTGDVSWTGGTYHPFVEGDLNQGQADLWLASGRFTIGGGAGTPTLAPAALDGEGNPMMPTSGFHWTILRATSAFINNTQPSYNNAIWTLTPVYFQNWLQSWDMYAV